MSYDLHGVWDAHNPIGSIVQSHTNLSEIKLAADLLWRLCVKGRSRYVIWDPHPCLDCLANV